MGCGGVAEGVAPCNPDLGDPLGAVWALSSVNCPAYTQSRALSSSRQVFLGGGAGGGAMICGALPLHVQKANPELSYSHQVRLQH